MNVDTTSLRFSKMHGSGNDFVLIDCRERALALSPAQILRLADRHRGVGFDQLLTVRPSTDPDCAFAYGVHNRDGSAAGQCGNGVRCVAAWLRREGALGEGLIRLMSPTGPVAVEILADGRVRVDMGAPDFAAAAVPIEAVSSGDGYTLTLDESEVELDALSMGNPHAVLRVDDVDSAPVETLGPRLQRDRAFPQSVNIGFVQIMARDRVRLRVWERGVGETQACGSGACAAMAALRRRDLLDAAVAVELPGGQLDLFWQGVGHPVWMTGPAAFVFDGDYYQ